MFAKPFRTPSLKATTATISSLCVAMALAAPASAGSSAAIEPIDEISATKLAPRPAVEKAKMPRYPLGALDRDKEGWVIVSLDVDEAGQAQNVRVLENSGTNWFDRSTLRAFERYQFVAPASYNRTENLKYKVTYRLD